MRARVLPLVLFAAVLALPPGPAEALDRLCDSSFENCRTPLLELIRNETTGIDVAFWFMTDARYATELVRRHQAGVRVRVLMDTRANASYAQNAETLRALRDAGIPMREKTSGGILHWKMMLFAGQRVVQFSGANYSPQAFVPIDPYVNYVDEAIYFTDDPIVVNSFMTKYDDVWTTTSGYSSHANVGALVRHYPTYAIDPELNFPPGSGQDFGTRSVERYNAERSGIDAIIYRITDRRHTDALINARARGIPVRIITEPVQYRDPQRLWHSWNVDRLYMAGVQIRHRKHLGLTHEKLTVLHGQGMTILGSSNWTGPSANSQLEHNYFTRKSAIYSWAVQHFSRKWHNSRGYAETEPFVPLPPDRPTLQAPVNSATGQGSTVTVRWYAGPWAHKYDVLVGTSTSALVRVATDIELGPHTSTSSSHAWTVSGLAPGTTYYWQVVSRTMANMERASAVWSFTTAGTAGSGTCGALPSGWANRDIGNVGAAGRACQSSGVFTVTGAGADIWGTADAFHFAYQTLTGDGSVTVRVTAVENIDPWTKAGVMMRESLAADAAHASMFVSPGKGLAFQRRVTRGGVTTHTSAGSGTAPRWVRLVRTGNRFSAYVSSDGSNWALAGSETIAMGATIYVGVPITSHKYGSLARATVERVTVGGP